MSAFGWLGAVVLATLAIALIPRVRAYRRARHGAKRILVLNGHPDEGSLCDSLARAYAGSARAAGHDVHLTNVRELRFDLVLHGGFAGGQPLEPDLQEQQRLIRWCDHLVIVTPNWHSGFPALLKGFVDRVFLPDFGVTYLAHFPYVKKLMRGKSARLIYTENTPRWLGRFARGDLVGEYVWRVPKRALLGHNGFWPIRKTAFTPVEHADRRRRERWLHRVEALGARAV